MPNLGSRSSLSVAGLRGCTSARAEMAARHLRLNGCSLYVSTTAGGTGVRYPTKGLSAVISCGVTEDESFSVNSSDVIGVYAGVVRAEGLKYVSLGKLLGLNRKVTGARLVDKIVRSVNVLKRRLLEKVQVMFPSTNSRRAGTKLRAQIEAGENQPSSEKLVVLSVCADSQESVDTSTEAPPALGGGLEHDSPGSAHEFLERADVGCQTDICMQEVSVVMLEPVKAERVRLHSMGKAPPLSLAEYLLSQEEKYNVTWPMDEVLDLDGSKPARQGLYGRKADVVVTEPLSQSQRRRRRRIALLRYRPAVYEGLQICQEMQSILRRTQPTADEVATLITRMNHCTSVLDRYRDWSLRRLQERPSRRMWS